MVKKLAILLVLLLVALVGARVVIASYVSSAYQTADFQRVLTKGISRVLRRIGVDAEVRISGIQADGIDCLIRSIKMSVPASKDKVFEITEAKISPAIWTGIFGSRMSVSLSGYFEGKRGSADIILTPGLLGAISGGVPDLLRFEGEVEDLSKAWISDFLFASYPSSPRVRFKEGTLSIKGDMVGKSGRVDLNIKKPVWEAKIRKKRRIEAEDIQIELEVGPVGVKLSDPALIKTKLGKISILGDVGFGEKGLDLMLHVSSKGKPMMSIIASRMFNCGKRLPGGFRVSGTPPNLECR